MSNFCTPKCLMTLMTYDTRDHMIKKIAEK